MVMQLRSIGLSIAICSFTALAQEKETITGKRYVTLKPVPWGADLQKLLDEPADRLNGFIDSQLPDDDKVDLKALQSCINECYDINIRYFKRNPYQCWQTPLVAAIKKGNQQVFRYLLDQPDIDVNQKNFMGLTPLMIAIFKKKEFAIDALLKDPRTNLNLTSVDSKTALDHIIALSRYIKRKSKDSFSHNLDSSELNDELHYYEKMAERLEQLNAKKDESILTKIASHFFVIGWQDLGSVYTEIQS